MAIICTKLERPLYYFLGGILVYAGALKILSPYETLEAVRSYLLLIPVWVLAISLWLVSFLEIVLGSLMMAGYKTKFSIVAPIITVLVFSVFWGISSGRFFTSSEGGCGCFGALRLFDSPLAALIRDTVLLLFAIGLLVSTPSGISIKRRVLASIIPLIMISSLGFTAANGLVKEMSVYNVDRDRMISSDWFGLPLETFTKPSLNDILEHYYGVDARTIWNADSNYYTVVNTKSDSSDTLGWIVLRALPLPNYTWGIFRLAALYRNNYSLIDVILDLPNYIPLRGRPSSEALVNYKRQLLSRYSASFLVYAEDCRLHGSDVLGVIITESLNNITHQLIISCPTGGLNGRLQ